MTIEHVCTSTLCEHIDMVDMKIISDVVHGCTNKEISEKRGYSVQTVKNRLVIIGRKLGLPQNRAQRTAIAVHAVRAGWDI